MTLEKFMRIYKDYYLGGLSILPDDLPDGAWFQIRLDTVEYLSEPENLRHVAPVGTGDFNFTAENILHWLLENEEI